MAGVSAVHEAPARRPKRAPATALAAALLAASLAACNTADLGGATAPPVPMIPAPAVAVDLALLPGKWGLASYRDEKDRVRTEAEAKAACGNPYQIGKGANGGVMMHLADQPQPTEVFVKTTADGRSFIGPRGAPGLKEDRVVMAFQNGVLVTVWMDPSARERFGTMVFVRCA
jgi:hypothetical protein